MFYRIIFYLLGLLITSFSLSLMIIYLSYNNVGFSLVEILSTIIKSPYIFLLSLGVIISLLSLFYNLFKTKK